jgi:hypothetical protein
VADQITLVEGEGSTSFPITISQNYVLYCVLTYGKACTVHIKAVTEKIMFNPYIFLIIYANKD